MEDVMPDEFSLRCAELQILCHPSKQGRLIGQAFQSHACNRGLVIAQPVQYPAIRGRLQCDCDDRRRVQQSQLLFFLFVGLKKTIADGGRFPIWIGAPDSSHPFFGIRRFSGDRFNVQHDVLGRSKPGHMSLPPAGIT